MNVELNPQEQERKLALMKHLVCGISSFTKNTIAMKGGSSLRIFYGLPRFSEDIDLHGETPINLMNVITRQASSFGLKNIDIIQKKMTETVNRYMLHFDFKDDVSDTLKIECSFRGKWNQDDVKIIDDCAVMSLPFIAKGKMEAFLDRRKPRDVFDMCFLTKNHSDCFSRNDLKNIHEYMKQIGMNNMFSDMKHEIIDTNDWILKDVDCEETVLELFQTVDDLVGNPRRKTLKKNAPKP